MGFTSAGTFQVLNGSTAVFSVDDTGTITTGLKVTGNGTFSSYVVASSLRPGSSANIIDHNGTNFTFNDAVTVSGAVTATGLSVTGTLVLPSLSVTGAMLAADSITASKIADSAVSAVALSSGALFKEVNPTNIAAIAGAGVGWSGTGTAVSLRRYSTGSMTSERAFKSDISSISPETDKYELLNWVTFRYNAQKMRDYGLLSAGIDYEVPDIKSWGLIADEVEALFPEAVSIEVSDGASYRGIKHDTLRALEGVVIKDLIGRVKSLEARVAELEG